MKPNPPPSNDYPAWAAAAVLAAAGASLLLPALPTTTHPTSAEAQAPAVAIAGNPSLKSTQDVRDDLHSLSPLPSAASVVDTSVPAASEVFAGREAPIEEQPPTF